MTKQQNKQTITLVWLKSSNFQSVNCLTFISGSLHFQVKGSEAIDNLIETLKDDDSTTINLMLDDGICNYDKVFSSIKMFKSWIDTYNFKKAHGWS